MEPLKIGLAGLGTVGAGVLKLLAANGATLERRCGRALSVRAVSARDRRKHRAADLNGLEWFDDQVALATSPAIDVFVELIGGESGPAKDAVVAALKAGKPVVTANKALLAKH